MSYVSHKLLIVALFCFPILFVVNCSRNEDIKGEHLELPQGIWVPVTSMQEPMQVKFAGPYGEDLLALSCEKTNLNDGEKGAFSKASGRVGESLSFGNSITYFEYDVYGNRSVGKTENTLFFNFKILAYDKTNSVVTIVVLPPENNISNND